SISAACLTGAAVRLRPQPRSSQLVSTARRDASTAVAGVDDDSIANAAGAFAANDPFRLSNHPAAVRHQGGATPSSGAAPVAPPPRPRLTLKGIVGGPPWSAVVDGIPTATPNAVVHPGDVFDKLRIRSISADSVVIAGPDTTWVLTFVRP